MIRRLAGIGLVLAMLGFGIGVYHAAGLLRGGHRVVHRPTEISAPSLPGTMFVVQGGAIYEFRHGSFSQITPENGWMQPAPAPHDELVAVRRQPNYSDLYLLTTAGKSVAQLSHNASAVSAEENHWAFYPRFSPEGTLLYYDFDPKDYFNSYRIDLAIFASPLDANGKAVEWTQPNDYTGGDVSPLPLRGGGLIYTKYSIDDSFHVHAQIWAQKGAQNAGQALTAPELGCSAPALSPDEKLIAMVCNKGATQTAELDVATFDPATLALGSPAALVTGQLVASPTFSPDGKTIAFLAPSVPGGGFQLWTVGSSGPASTRDITTDLGLDSNSAPVWVA